MRRIILNETTPADRPGLRVRGLSCLAPDRERMLPLREESTGGVCCSAKLMRKKSISPGALVPGLAVPPANWLRAPPPLGSIVLPARSFKDTPCARVVKRALKGPLA